MKRIPLSIPNLNHNIIDNLTECIETNWIAGGGRFLTDFEKNMATYVGVPMATACQSGTGGIHASLHALGVTKNDLVISPTLTFIAAVNPISYLGADPIFMDCDDTLNMDLDKLEAFLKNECVIKDQSLIHKASQKRIPAMVVVHVFGNLINMEKVMTLAKAYHLKVVEDATEALGSCYTEGPFKGRFAGTIGHLGVYSFNANKIITTAGGGMVVGQDTELVKKVKYLTTQAKDDMIRFVHHDIGYNYRMTNLQAALGVSQLSDLEGFITIKENNYTAYQEGLSTLPGLTLLPFNGGTRSNKWFYSLYVNSKVYGMTRDQVMDLLDKNGVETRPIWYLCHLQKPYQSALAYKIEKALHYLDHIVSLPCSTSLTKEEIDYIISVLKKQ